MAGAPSSLSRTIGNDATGNPLPLRDHRNLTMNHTTTDTGNQTFPGLTPDEMRQLCYAAYYGGGGSATAYMKAFGTDREAYADGLGRLQAAGYVRGGGGVCPERYLDVLDYLALQGREWLEAFRQMRPACPTQTATYLWQVARLTRTDAFGEAARLAKPYEGLGRRLFNLYPYVRLRVMRDVRYAALLDGEQVQRMAEETMEEMFAHGRLDGATLESIARLARERGPEGRDVADRVALYRFFLTGEGAGQDGTTPWAVAQQAIRALYAGRTEDALSLFGRALQGLGRGAQAFPVPLLNFLYAVALVRYRTRYGPLTQTETTQRLRNAPWIRTDEAHAAARLLLDYAEVTTEEASEELPGRIARAAAGAADRQAASLTLLLGRYFGLDDASLRPVADVQPPAAILLHELSPYRPMGETARQELAQAFGGRPLLAHTRRRAAWEFLLGEVGRAAAARPAATAPRRIIYFMDGGTLTTLVEQAQQADLTWRDERILSQRILCTEGYESMDLADSRIAMQLAAKAQTGLTDAEILVPNLAGTGRLYVGTEYATPRTPARIQHEEPYVEFSGRGDRIVIASNALRTEDGTLRRHTVLRDGDDGFRLVSLDAVQKDVLERLLTRGALPASAARSLRPTVESLRGIMEVREDVLREADSQAAESDGRIAVRIESVRLEYRVTFLAAPLPDGTARLTPAEGEEYVFDEDGEGRTLCVHRDMEREGENLRMAVDLATQFGVEFAGGNVCQFGDDATLLQLLAFCHRHAERFTAEWPDGQQLKFKGILSPGDIDIEVKSDVEWFVVEGRATVGDAVVPIEVLLAEACHSGFDGFVKVGEHEYAQMTETLRRHIAELDAVLTMTEKRKRGAPRYLVGPLARSLTHLRHQADEGYHDFMAKMKEAYAADVPVPTGLRATLRPYQEDGYRWMRRMDRWGAGVCLADEMGLGKTVQALAFLLAKAEAGASLVVAPKSVVPNWLDEVARFAPALRVAVINDAPDRAALIARATAGDVLLCTYGILTTEAARLGARRWNTVCLDEAHHIKNRNTQVSRAAMQLRAGSRIILTGTPLQNHVGELWNLMQFLNPGLLGRWNVFRDTYINADLDPGHRRMLAEMTQPFILRRTKGDVLRDLPEKLESIRYVDLTEHEAKVYEEMRRMVAVRLKDHRKRHHETRIAEDEEREKSKLEFLAELTRLRLGCCDMHLLYDRWREPSSKVAALTEILGALREVPDNGILVFSQFTSFLAIVRRELGRLGWDYLYMDGQTPMPERRETVRRFQDGERRLFLASLKAGGIGLNLTAANYVILLDPWWNPAIESQAADRAHRIGQKRCVSVIRLICRHTIEEKILRLHDKKRQVTDDVLDGTADTHLLTYEDIMEMIAPF